MQSFTHSSIALKIIQKYHTIPCYVNIVKPEYRFLEYIIPCELSMVFCIFHFIKNTLHKILIHGILIKIKYKPSKVIGLSMSEVNKMAKMILSFQDVIELNHCLEESGLNFKVHLHDACGNQSFSVEPLGDSACEGCNEEMMKVVSEYFQKKSISIRFLENHFDFVVVS